MTVRICHPYMFHSISDYLFSQFEYEIIFKVQPQKVVMEGPWSNVIAILPHMIFLHMSLFGIQAFKSRRVDFVICFTFSFLKLVSNPSLHFSFVQDDVIWFAYFFVPLSHWFDNIYACVLYICMRRRKWTATQVQILDEAVRISHMVIHLGRYGCNYSPSRYGCVVRQIGFLILVCKTPLKIWPYITSCSCRVVGVYIYIYIYICGRERERERENSVES